MKRFLTSFISSSVLTLIGAILVVVNIDLSLAVLLVGLLGFLLSVVVLIQWLMESERALKNGLYRFDNG